MKRFKRALHCIRDRCGGCGVVRCRLMPSEKTRDGCTFFQSYRVFVLRLTFSVVTYRRDVTALFGTLV